MWEGNGGPLAPPHLGNPHRLVWPKPTSYLRASRWRAPAKKHMECDSRIDRRTSNCRIQNEGVPLMETRSSMRQPPQNLGDFLKDDDTVQRREV